MRACLIFTAILFAQTSFAEVTKSKCFLGTSAFVLANLDQNTTEPPKFYQLNFGYQMSQKDVISIEAITWKYYAPLGAPLSLEDSGKYPGSVTGQGLGLAYQRFLWKQLYTAIHATLFRQKYKDPNGGDLGKGQQLFLALRIGYRFTFFNDTFFIEPSVAMTHWPVNKGLPSSFEAKERAWPNTQFEPGMHLGLLF